MYVKRLNPLEIDYDNSKFVLLYNRSSKYIKQKFERTHRERNKPTPRVGDFNTLLSVTDRTSKKESGRI